MAYRTGSNTWFCAKLVLPVIAVANGHRILGGKASFWCLINNEGSRLFCWRIKPDFLAYTLEYYLFQAIQLIWVFVIFNEYIDKVHFVWSKKLIAQKKNVSGWFVFSITWFYSFSREVNCLRCQSLTHSMYAFIQLHKLNLFGPASFW